MVTEQALEGEEARYGERLIQFASENLVTEILIHPVVSTLAQCMRNLLSSFTKHRHIIHAGYTFAANGSWALQDGTFSYTDFAEAFQELEVQRVIRAYENGITIDLHCSPEGDWTKLPKEQFTKACKVRLNPSDVLTSGSPAINNFINYISPFLIPTSLESLLESSDVVGNIRFSRPTLYVFPGGQGDAALFGINGFNMLLDGGYGRKACFWDFVRHLDRLDAVLMTRLNNSNVGGISSVLRRKKQDALYPQIGHFFCNLQERKALLSPDGDKDRDPLLINLLDEGQEIVSNLRHLHLTPQVCYRDSEPINLYHKVGHGTLDMYILSPAKDSKEVREFLHKWNQSDVRLFANAKSSREFSFPLQNLVSIAALLVWQPADPEDTITRILFPGSCPQTKIFEGLDRLKSLEFVKSAVCSEKSLSGTTTKKAALIERIATKDKDKIIADKKENKMIENNITEVNIEVKEKTVKKSDSTESDKSIKQKKIDDHKIENGDKAKPKPRPMKPRSDSQQRRKPIDKKASPKKIPTENGDVKRPIKPSPIGTPAKSAKDASNRRVIESKVKQPPAAPTKPSAEPKPKVERKPISRRPKAPKAPISPVKKLVNGVQKPDSISRKGRLDKEGTTDSSTVSTPSVDQESVLKKDISKLTPEELQQLKAQELADLKEEQEAVKEIEAVFRKGEGIKDTADDENLRKVKDVSIDEEKLEEKEEYLIIEKEVIQQDSMEDKEPKEDETQKLARDSEESEKRRKPSVEEQRVDIESQINGIVNEAEDIVKSKDEHVEGSKVTSPEDKGDSGDKKLTDEVKDVVESHPDEKVSVNIKSGDTTTAPTLPEDEKVPLDEIKEDSGHVIEEKHVKEDTKEKDVPMIPPPPKPVETVGKIPSVIGIKLDKHSHIRDIVKTPDEVADLPVHEEADIEYTQDAKAETEKSNEIVEDKKSEEKAKSKEETKTVESEKDSDELAQEKSKEVVPKMEEELKHLTDTVIKTELKTDTLEDKAGEDKKVEDHIPKKDEFDKKIEMETKSDIVEKQEEEEREFNKESTKEKSPDKHDVVKDAKKEPQKEDEENGGKAPDDLKAEPIQKDVAEEDKQEVTTGTQLHESKTEKPESHLEKHLKDESEKLETKQMHETVIIEAHVSKTDKFDEEKHTRDVIKELKHEAEAELGDSDNKDAKEYVEKDKPIKDKTEPCGTSTKEQATTHAKDKMHEPTKHKEEMLESKIELELKESKETTKDIEDEVKTDKKDYVEKTSTEKGHADDVSTKPDEKDKDKVEHDIEDVKQEKIKDDWKLDETKTTVDNRDRKSPEQEKDGSKTPQEVKDHKIDAGPMKELERDDEEHTKEKTDDEKTEKVHDTKSDQKLHEETTKDVIKEDEKKDEEAEKKLEPQKERDTKHEPDDYSLEKSGHMHTELEKAIVVEAKKEDRKSIDEGIQNHVEALKDSHFEGTKSGSQEDITSEKLEKHDKEPLGEEKQDEIDTTKQEHKKSISEIEKIELGRKSPMDLGRKSPKEREEDVIKIVASVAEVLKSDAPLEEFEGKLPIDTFASFTSELRETHITTLDSPSATNGVKSDITSTFIKEEKNHEIEPTDRRSSLLKESQDLMMATSKMISDIKTAKTDEKENEEEVGTVHRMLVTASSEDGGEEIEICPPGSITFSRSSESSGRSSPDHSQKLSQKSSVIDTVSESLTTVRTREQEEKDSGIDDGKSDVELPDQKSTTEKVSGRESPLKKVEDASIKTISGKSTPDKDASIKSIASGKSTPDISDLEQSKDTDEFKKTEEDMSIEAVEKIEAETVAKKDERPEQKPEELTKPGDSHTKEQKEDVKDKKEDKREEEELGYIRDTSPKDLDYDANKVENDKTPEKSPSKAHDHLKKESDIEEEQLFRKPSLKADELLKKDIQEVQQNFFDSDAKDTVITDGIDIDETSPVQISPSDGKPLQDEIQECVEKDIKAEDAKQHAFEAIQENFVGDLESKSVKQTDDFLRKEIEAEQHDFVSTVSKDDGAKDIYKMTVDEKALGKDTKEEQIDGDDKVSYHTLPKAEFPEKVDPTKATGKDESSLVSEHLREEIKEVQDSFVDSITKDTTDEAKTVIESAERIDEKISSKSIGTKDNMKIEHKHEDAAKKDMTVAENIEEGYKESLRKSSKAEEALKEEIRELQESLKKSSKTEEMLREEIRDLQHPTESKTDKPKDVEQMKDDTIGIKEAVEEKPTDKDLLPRKPSLKADKLLKDEIQAVQDSFIASEAKDDEGEIKSADKDLLPRKPSLKAEELLKEEIQEVQESFVEALAKDAEIETISSEDLLARKPSLKYDELLKKEIAGVQETFVEADAKDAEAEVKSTDKDVLPRKPSLKAGELLKEKIQKSSDEELLPRKSKGEELLKKEIEEMQESVVEAATKDVEAETKSTDKDLLSRKPSLKAEELLKEETQKVQQSFVEAVAKDAEAETKSTDNDLLPRKSSLKAEELLKKEIDEVQEPRVKSVVKDAEAEITSSEEDEMLRKPSLKGEELLKKQIEEVQESFVEAVSKDAEAEDLLPRKPSLKDDELVKKEIQVVQGPFIEAVAKDVEAETKSTEEDLSRKSSLKPDELVKKEIQGVQESFVEAVAKDSEAETKSMEKDLSPRKPSLNADELLKKEILEVQESFVEAIAKDSEAETKSTETDLLPPKPDELLKKEIQEVQGSFVEAEVKDAEAETKSMEKDLLPRKPSLKPDELLKKEIQEVQQSFVEGVAKDAEADTKSTEKDLLHRKPSLKPDDLLKKETQEVQESLVEAVAKHAETEIKSTEKDLLPRKPSLKADELVNKEIQEVQESFVEAVVKDAEAETKSTEKDGLPRKPSLKADEVLKKEIQEVQESFVEAVAKDSEAETKSTDKDLSRKPSLKADELLKKEIQDVQESFVESVAKDAEAETKTTEKDSSRKPSLKADELLKKELQEVQESFVEAVAKDSEAETKSTEKDLLSRKPSLKADELLKKEIQEVQESFIEAVTKDAEFELKEESHADVESPKKAAAEETKDTTEVKSSTDRRSSLTSNGLIKDAKSHQKDERIGTRTESEKEQIIKADEEIKKAIKEIQDEFIESVAEDFVIIDRIKKDDTVALEEATVADEFDSKVKSPSVKETPEKALEQSAAELADTFKNVTDMSKSVMFDKCETSTIDPTVVKKDEEDLEKKAEDIEDAYETVNALAKSISFEKLTDKSHKKDDKICVTDGTSTITTDNVSETSQKDGKLLERHADGTEDSVPKPEKSIKFEVEEKCEINKTTKKDEDLLKERASDIEDAYETVSKLAKTIPFEKVEDTLHIDKETLKKDEKLLEQRADDIEDAYDTVKKLATDISFEKVDSGSHIDQAVIEHDEKILEQTAGDVEKAYDTVTKLSKRISFDKVEDKRGDKDNVPTDVTKHSTAQEQTIVESGKRVTDETAVEKVRKDSISRSRKESLSEHTHEMDIHTKSTLEVTHSSSQAKKLSISDVEILLTGDKSAGDKDISGAATPPTVPVSPNIKEASSPEVRYTEYTESDSHFNVTEQMDPMCMSFYGSLPEDDQADEDIKEGAVTHLYEVTKAKFSTPVLEPVDAGKGQHGQTEDQPTSSKDKDSDKSLGKPLGLPPPPYPTYLYEITKAKYSTGTDNEAEVNEEVQSSYLYREMDMMNTSFYGSLPTEEDDIDPLRMWGKPLGLPSPAPPNDNKGTPKKERKLPSNVSAKNKLNDDKKRAESPSKHNRNKKNNPIYVDLTYVPHHGNTYYAYVDFFKRIRARYYVFSGIEPSREVYNALLEAKQTWEDKDLEVTIIPTYDTDVLGYWVAENEDLLAKYKIDLSPSASRCTINLQDHETSCSAYRLEF
ncbi:unnamed protein product [Acanthoscelides obtectus]|uniref:Microtubule-associated protein futsch n=1 Tax=Acanthoscelides obtectus TaxID=200917 RepID=A0A9P0LK10_ACAOB|nr:unnamed protein product [Acanthoscelides obtectus]CAK1653314.1 Microtubule-associated protein futsch [Acanthoscelides obtectus]